MYVTCLEQQLYGSHRPSAAEAMPLLVVCIYEEADRRSRATGTAALRYLTKAASTTDKRHVCHVYSVPCDHVLSKWTGE